jgi:hypothetical protein
MPNVNAPEETHRKIEALIDHYNHPATKKWVVEKAVEELYINEGVKDES